jgi:hypothetical protein
MGIGFAVFGFTKYRLLQTALPVPAYHAHANWAVFIRGEQYNFSGAEYQSTEEKQLDPATHLHDGVGTIMHFHEVGISLHRFLQSLSIELTTACLIMNGMDAFCTNGTESLKVWVNGAPIENWETYIPNDLDRILISFGSEAEEALKKQMDLVTDDACIYSETCPERGEPPTENCVGGLGSSCAL